MSVLPYRVVNDSRTRRTQTVCYGTKKILQERVTI